MDQASDSLKRCFFAIFFVGMDLVECSPRFLGFSMQQVFSNFVKLEWFAKDGSQHVIYKRVSCIFPKYQEFFHILRKYYLFSEVTTLCDRTGVFHRI